MATTIITSISENAFFIFISIRLRRTFSLPSVDLQPAFGRLSTCLRRTFSLPSADFQHKKFF